MARVFSSFWILLSICLSVSATRGGDLKPVLKGAVARGQTQFNLYSFPTKGESWKRAYEQCRGKGQHLTAILDRPIQEALMELDKPTQEAGGTRHAWIAGIRFDSKDYYWVNSTGYAGKPFGILKNQCAAKQGANLTAWYCTDLKQSRCRILKDAASGEDSSDGAIPFNFSIPNKRYTWYEARMNCMQSDGDLASDPEGVGDDEVWIGLRNNIWTWNISTGMDTSDVTPMDFYNFSITEGGNKNEMCAHIDLMNNFQWADKECGAKCKYFICDNGSIPEGSTSNQYDTTVTTTDMSSTETSQYNDSTDDEVVDDTSASRLSGFSVLISSVTAAVVVTVIVVVVIIIIIVRRRRANSRTPKPRNSPVTVSNGSPGIYSCAPMADDAIYHEVDDVRVGASDV